MSANKIGCFKPHLCFPAGSLAACLLAGLLLTAPGVFAEEKWGVDLEVYGWVPDIDIKSQNGIEGEITRSDILDNLDLVAMWAARARKGRWSVSSDFVYFKISDDVNKNVAIIPDLPDLAKVTDKGLEAWIITPNIGYTAIDNTTQKVELYAGARYFWIEVDATIEVDPLLPGGPSLRRKESPTESNWDAIVGVRGLYYLPRNWFIPYSVNVGGGQSDFTWGVQAGLGYDFDKFSALLGWRYLRYELDNDALLKKISINGPFAGVKFSW